jgi:hypothetical protein
MRTSALMLAGSAVSAFAIVALVAALTAGAKPVWFRTGMRIVGSWAAAIALLVLALQFARSGG